jgi:hypothetical protein
MPHDPTVRVHARPRPYIITFKATGTSYPLNSEEVQRLLDSYPVLEATRNRVALRADDGERVVIQPATRGGGAGFEVNR